jgi:hypothetical protein
LCTTTSDRVSPYLWLTPKILLLRYIYSLILQILVHVRIRAETRVCQPRSKLTNTIQRIVDGCNRRLQCQGPKSGANLFGHEFDYGSSQFIFLVIFAAFGVKAAFFALLLGLGPCTCQLIRDLTDDRRTRKLQTRAIHMSSEKAIIRAFNSERRLSHITFLRYFRFDHSFHPAFRSLDPSCDHVLGLEKLPNGREHAVGTEVSARHLSSLSTCELHLSRDSSSPAYSSWLCI